MSRKLSIPAGERYGRLTVISETTGSDKRHRYFTCICDCGKGTTTKLNSMRSGNTQSCGCLSVERTTQLNRTHGQSNTRTHVRWRSMLTRATNPNITHAKSYTGRGIGVCERWLTFENFLADMGECPPNHSLDRIDNDQSYQPGNCRWATPQQQGRNRHRSGKHIGVRQLPSGNWRAFICTDHNRNLHIGTYRTLEEAVQARLSAELEHWGDSASTVARNSQHQAR